MLKTIVHKKLCITYGKDNTGNINNWENIDYIESLSNQKFYLVTADGGFDEEYPNPPSVIVIEVTIPAVTLAVAVALLYVGSEYIAVPEYPTVTYLPSRPTDGTNSILRRIFD